LLIIYFPATLISVQLLDYQMPMRNTVPIKHRVFPPKINPEIPRPELPEPYLSLNPWTPEPYAWLPLKDYQKRPENNTPYTRPWHVGYLWQRKEELLVDPTLRRKPLGGWHWYLCRVCGRSYAQHRPPHMIRRKDCGCVRTEREEAQAARPRVGKGGGASQTVRMEGHEVGWLTPTEYMVGKGWECVCRCGDVCFVATLRLKQRAVLGCPACVPEDWEAKAGRKPAGSRHGQILRKMQLTGEG
jgi:hypothetical protein